MANKTTIMAAIERKVGDRYSLYRIGLTHDVGERKKYWKETEKENVDCWADWEADSLENAQDIEAHFISNGMKGGTGGDLSSRKTVYVYVF
jgi:hypothetical protein